MRIRDYLELPESTDLDAFITKLGDTEERVRENLRLFVLPDPLFEKLDGLLKTAGQRLAGGQDFGRFIHGSFGSGKSHLMTVLGRMLAQDEAVYQLGDAKLRILRERHPWLGKQKTLVVGLNMMGKRSLVSALYEAFNAALPPEVPPLSFTDEERVFGLIERDAERMGGMDALIAQLIDAGAIPSPGFFERGRAGDLEKRLDLAARLLSWRNHGEAPVNADSLWVPAPRGFARIARHLKDHGYTSITWLIDELVIWVRGKSRDVYIQQLNDLSSMVDKDHTRALPFAVFVAVQKDIKDTCPDDISESAFREHLGFISNRFRPSLELAEQDLIEVTARRVLRRKEDSGPKREAFEAAIDACLKKHRKTVDALAGGRAPEEIRKLYPFNPALLHVLVDMTQGLSRNRTAVAALYRLLEIYPDLKVGEFVPLGALWEVIFTDDYIQALRSTPKGALVERMLSAADTYDRLTGKIDDVSRGEGAHDPALVHALVRSVLMCQLSERPYYVDGRALREVTNASTLFRLNQQDVNAVIERTGVTKVTRSLKALAGRAPQVQVSESADPDIHIKTEQVDVERLLARARSDLRHVDRFRYMKRLLVAELGLDLGDGLRAGLDVRWRGTRRRGRLELENVRKLSYAGQNNRFDPGEDAFLVILDYPFDEESGKGRQEDIDTTQRARNRKTQWSVAWLPEHLSSTEVEQLDNATAVELIRENRAEYMQGLSTREADEAARALEQFQIAQNQVLSAAIRRLYFEEGQVHALTSALDGIEPQGLDRNRAVEAIATRILDARFPRHPTFGRRVGLGELNQVIDWVTRAAVTGQAVTLATQPMALAKAIAVPLEVVYASESSITPRKDGRYLQPILQWAEARRTFRASELKSWLMDEGREGFGFTEEVCRFFLYYLLQVEGYEARDRGKGLTLHGLSSIPADFELVKAEVVDAPTWDGARRVAQELLELSGRAELPSSPEQSKLSRDAQQAARALLSGVDAFARKLGAVCAWAGVQDSERQEQAAALSDRLSVLETTEGAAEVVGHLARLGEEPLLPLWITLRRQLQPERLALDKIAQQQNAFAFVRTRGPLREKEPTVQTLQARLKDPMEAGALSDYVGPWVQAIGARFRALMEEVPPEGPRPPQEPPPPQGPIDPPPSSRRILGEDRTLPVSELEGYLKVLLRQIQDAAEPGESVRLRVFAERPQ